MQRAERPVLAEVRFGRDADHLYFAFVPGSEGLLPGDRLDVWLDAAGSGPRQEGPRALEAALRLHVELGIEGDVSADVRHHGRQGWTTLDLPACVARAEVVEIALPLRATLALLEPQGGTSISFVVTADREGGHTDRLPLAGAVDWDLSP